MPDRYSYENLSAAEFERLVSALVREAGVTADAIIHTHFVFAPQFLSFDPLRWILDTLGDNGENIRRLTSEGSPHYILATNFMLPTMTIAPAENLRKALAERAKDYGLASLSVWWRNDISERLDQASNAVRLNFKQVLPEDERRAATQFQERFAAARNERRGDFREIGLPSMPPEAVRIPNLNILNLAGNRITGLPPEIGRPLGLKALYLQGNQLTSLPPEIGRLTNLETLILRNNKLSALPPAIGGLTNLKALDLQGNRLTSLPPEIGRLTNLETLDLLDNKLSDLPEELSHLTKLSPTGSTTNGTAWSRSWSAATGPPCLGTRTSGRRKESAHSPSRASSASRCRDSSRG